MRELSHTVELTLMASFFAAVFGVLQFWGLADVGYAKTTNGSVLPTSCLRSNEDPTTRVLNGREAKRLIEQLEGDKLEWTEFAETLASVTKLTDDAARVLSQFEGELWLVAVGALSENQAQALAQHKGPLFHDGLTSLSDSVAANLAHHKSDENCLTPNNLSLNGVRQLSEAAAECFSGHQGQLSLGLTELSSMQAKQLSKHEGGLLLNQITTLDDGVAENLARSEGTSSLNGLRSITDAQLSSLAKHDGPLNLNGLLVLSDAAATALSMHEGGVLSLNGLTSLSAAQAESLIGHQEALGLQGVTSMSDEAAHILSKFNRRLYIEVGRLPESCVEIIQESRKPNGYPREQ